MILDEIINQDQLVLVDFYRENCGPCTMLAAELALLEIEFKDSMTIIRIDVDKNVALTTQYSIMYQMRGVPTMMLFKQGKLLWKHSGYLKKNVILMHIENHKHNF